MINFTNLFFDFSFFYDIIQVSSDFAHINKGNIMKIVIVCDILGKKNNGTSIASYNLINSLKEKGHSVKVVCCDLDESENNENGQFIVLDKLNLGPLNKIVERNGVSLPLKDKKKIVEAIKGCDIVHVMLPFPLGITACRIAKRLGKPVTAGFHCQAELVSSHLGLMNCEPFNTHIYKQFYKHLYQYCDAVHYPTKFICDVFENIVGRTNHYIISNGVNKYMTYKPCEKPDDLKDKFIILSTGRLCKEKSHITLFEAVALSKQNSEIQLIIAGQGPLQKRLEKYAEENIVNPPIIKYFSRSEMADLVNYADLYVHPAKAELEGIACLEAVASGLVPVVSNSKKSATKDFAISDNNIFKCDDPKDLASKIDFWFEHPKEKQIYKDKYIQFGERFNQEECMNRMEQMFIDVLESRVK